MIAELVLRFGVFLVEKLLGVIPVIPVPGWVTSPSGAVATVFQAAGSMGVWFPGPLAITVIGAVLVVKVAGLGIRLARMILSLLTGGGGNAGG